MNEGSSFLKDIILGGVDRLNEINNKEKIELFPWPEDNFKKIHFFDKLSKEDLKFLSYFLSFIKNYTRCHRGNPYLPPDQTRPEFEAQEVFHFFKNGQMIESFAMEYYEFLRSYLKVTESPELNVVRSELDRCVPYIKNIFVTFSLKRMNEDYPKENISTLVDFCFENYHQLLRNDFPEPAKPVLIFLPVTSYLTSSQIETFNQIITEATPLLEPKGVGNDDEFAELINDENLGPLSSKAKEILINYKDFVIQRIEEREAKIRQREAEKEQLKETNTSTGPKSALDLLAEFEKDLDKK